eukprot:2275979-Pleurochrysis_carterae.AAC.1
MSGGARASLVMSAVVCFASRLRANCNGGLETNFQRARAHQIRFAHQLIRLWQVDPFKFLCRFSVVCCVAPLECTTAVQARRLAIDAHST